MVVNVSLFKKSSMQQLLLLLFECLVKITVDGYPLLSVYINSSQEWP